jgi:hypothetical protein
MRKVQPPGIEPGSKPWEGSIMPLDHGCTPEKRAQQGIEPWTSRTLSENHATRPLSRVNQWLPEKSSPTRIRTVVARFRVSSANHYTMGEHIQKPLPPGFEPGSPDSRSGVLTTTLWERRKKQRSPRIEPGFPRPQRGVLTTKL